MLIDPNKEDLLLVTNLLDESFWKQKVESSKTRINSLKSGMLG